VLKGRVVEKRDFPIWKTLKLGTHESVDEIHRDLTEKGFRVSEWANDILGKVKVEVSPRKTTANLVRVSVEELGFKEGATRAEIYDRAQELGLELCPAEVGPQLRLQYNDQPNGDWVLIGMEPITDSDGSPSVFNVACDRGDRWLYAVYSRPDYFWNSNNRWIFVLRA
jgi:hypothetical protein